MKRVDRRTFLVNSLRTGRRCRPPGRSASRSGRSTQPSHGDSHRGRPWLSAPTAIPLCGRRPRRHELRVGGLAIREGAVQTAYGSWSPTRFETSTYGIQEMSSPRAGVRLLHGAALDLTRIRLHRRDPRSSGVWSRSRPASFLTGLRRGTGSRVVAARTGRHRARAVHVSAQDVRAAQGDIEHAVAYTAAAHKYQLWLNGQKLDTGPSFCYPDEQYVQATDVTAALSAGGRTPWASCTTGTARQRETHVDPGPSCGVIGRITDGRRVVVGTDGTWKQRKPNGYPPRSATLTPVTSSR